MYKEISTVTVNGVDEQREITYYEFQDLTPESTWKVANDFDSVIELGSCPVCGKMTTLNQSSFGYYAWCPICGLEGPKHPDPYSAAKMFAERNFTTVAEVYKFSPEKVKKFRLDKFDIKNRHRVEEFANREVKR